MASNSHIIDSGVKQQYVVSILPLSTIYHWILEMFRPSIIFLFSYYAISLKNITNFLQVKEQNQTYRRLITIITRINMFTMTTPATTPPIIPRMKKNKKNVKTQESPEPVSLICISMVIMYRHM